MIYHAVSIIFLMNPLVVEELLKDYVWEKETSRLFLDYLRDITDNEAINHRGLELR